jgi:hypothetical protein
MPADMIIDHGIVQETVPVRINSATVEKQPFYRPGPRAESPGAKDVLYREDWVDDDARPTGAG